MLLLSYHSSRNRGQAPPERSIKPCLQFLPTREFDDITTALNFSTPDCHVVGNVDLYTTKAAGTDKKLYKDIENSLETQYESLLKLSASLSPPQQTGFSPLDLSRSSPFGPLSQISSRRTFAYLIATLNASHPDYDFSHVLRPKDFKREKSLKSVINNIDSTLYNLRPSQKMAMESPTNNGSSPTGAIGGAQTWGPRMWALIDKEMSLKDCSVYCWAPTESVWEGEEGAIWTLNYFFFNKIRKRVAYFYLRGIPVMTHSPRLGFARRNSKAQNDEGASKRARYWLGDKAANARGIGEEDDGSNTDNDLPMALDDEEEFDLNDVSDDYTSDVDFDEDMYDDIGDDDNVDLATRVRGVSEEVADKMEL